jgi:phospholipase C
MAHDRRRFLKAVSAGALTALLPPNVQRALAVEPRRKNGSIRDIEHIVILMQENRSFDHYYGTMRGVRGYGDPRAARLPSGDPVFAQPTGSGVLLPFRDAGGNLGDAFLQGTPHNWPDAHQAWNKGKYDQWVPAKGTTTMSHLRRDDIPYHFALADAFTVCDAYHCSFMGATDPNRYHMWTGWVGNDGKAGGPVVDNSELGYDWHTFPEYLDDFGISWKVYQDTGAGLDAANYWGWGPNPYIGNYGDNSLLYFHQYQNAPAGSPLRKAFNATDIKTGGSLFEQFAADVAADTLPRVSWIVAPEAYTEHSNWPSNYGAWYVDAMLGALLDHPEVFAKTAFFLTFDENDGLFDHMIPPTPPESRAGGLSTVATTNEIYPGNGGNYAPGPYGLGARVPMLVISPWSKGGWVCSEVFDHTSLIRFIEKRFEKETKGKLIEPNITPWRRAIAGDLTACFDFKSPSTGIVALPPTAGYAPPDNDFHPDYVPTPPATQTMPKQEPGVRPARPVPYDPDCSADIDLEHGKLELRFENKGRSAVVFQVRAGMSANGPWTYTVEPKKHLSDTWAIDGSGQTTYDYSVFGPNGFFRGFRGGNQATSAKLEVKLDASDCGVTLELKSACAQEATVRIYDAYAKRTVTQRLGRGRSLVWHFDLEESHGWYDLTVTVDNDGSFLQRLAGHVESGRDSASDPAFGV